MKIDSAVIEVSVSTYFDRTQNFAITNVREGFGLRYEVDLMIVTKSLYAYEIEIKVSASDLKRDQKKWRYRHGWEPGSRFRKSYYAMPESMKDQAGIIPECYGILLVGEYPYVQMLRDSQINTAARKLTETEYAGLGRLCMLRMWKLKRALVLT